MADTSDLIFVPGRLRVARELHGVTQAGLAKELGLSGAAISQFEAGNTQPSADTVDALAGELDVPARFFYVPLTDTHEGFFRSLRRTPVASRRRARGYGLVAHDIATFLPVGRSLPQLNLPQHKVDELTASRQEIEAIATQVRVEWRVSKGPLVDVVGLMERHGITVIRLPMQSADVDAFSLPFRDRPVVVLGAEKNDRARSRFDAAHELGHLVMHGEQVWGLKEIERQAHQFAAAFLMPADQIFDELPTAVIWPVLFDLKRKWQVSLAALLIRAKDLGRLTDSQYLTAVKASSARGWRRLEPIPLGAPELPGLLSNAMTQDVELGLQGFLPSSVVGSLKKANAV